MNKILLTLKQSTDSSNYIQEISKLYKKRINNKKIPLFNQGRVNLLNLFNSSNISLSNRQFPYQDSNKKAINTATSFSSTSFNTVRNSTSLPSINQGHNKQRVNEIVINSNLVSQKQKAYKTRMDLFLSTLTSEKKKEHKSKNINVHLRTFSDDINSFKHRYVSKYQQQQIYDIIDDVVDKYKKSYPEYASYTISKQMFNEILDSIYRIVSFYDNKNAFLLDEKVVNLLQEEIFKMFRMKQIEHERTKDKKEFIITGTNFKKASTKKKEEKDYSINAKLRMQNQKRWRKGNISTVEDYDSDRIFEAFYDVLFKEEKEIIRAKSHYNFKYSKEIENMIQREEDNKIKRNKSTLEIKKDIKKKKKSLNILKEIRQKHNTTPNNSNTNTIQKGNNNTLSPRKSKMFVFIPKHKMKDTKAEGINSKILFNSLVSTKKENAKIKTNSITSIIPHHAVTESNRETNYNSNNFIQDDNNTNSNPLLSTHRYTKTELNDDMISIRYEHEDNDNQEISNRSKKSKEKENFRDKNKIKNVTQNVSKKDNENGNKNNSKRLISREEKRKKLNQQKEEENRTDSDYDNMDEIVDNKIEDKEESPIRKTNTKKNKTNTNSPKKNKQSKLTTEQTIGKNKSRSGSIQSKKKKKLIKLKEDESKEDDITQSRNPNENILNLNKDIESIKDNNSFKSSSSRKNSTHSIKGNKSPRSPKSPSLILTNNKKLSQFASTFNQKTPRNNIINDVLFKDNHTEDVPQSKKKKEFFEPLRENKKKINRNRGSVQILAHPMLSFPETKQKPLVKIVQKKEEQKEEEKYVKKSNANRNSLISEEYKEDDDENAMLTKENIVQILNSKTSKRFLRRNYLNGKRINNLNFDNDFFNNTEGKEKKDKISSHLNSIRENKFEIVEHYTEKKKMALLMNINQDLNFYLNQADISEKEKKMYLEFKEKVEAFQNNVLSKYQKGFQDEDEVEFFHDFESLKEELENIKTIRMKEKRINNFLMSLSDFRYKNKALHNLYSDKVRAIDSKFTVATSPILLQYKNKKETSKSIINK